MLSNAATVVGSPSSFGADAKTKNAARTICTVHSAMLPAVPRLAVRAVVGWLAVVVIVVIPSEVPVGLFDGVDRRPFANSSPAAENFPGAARAGGAAGARPAR